MTDAMTSRTAPPLHMPRQARPVNRTAPYAGAMVAGGGVEADNWLGDLIDFIGEHPEALLALLPLLL